MVYIYIIHQYINPGQDWKLEDLYIWHRNQVYVAKHKHPSHKKEQELIVNEVLTILISGKHQRLLSISVELQLHWLAPQVGGKFNLETWTENHGVSMASNYHFCYWCQSPRSDLMSSVFPPLSLQTIYTEHFLSCGPFRNRPCTRGCIADFFWSKKTSPKWLVPAVFSQVGDLIKTKNARKGLEDFVPWRLIGLKNQISWQVFHV